MCIYFHTTILYYFYTTQANNSYCISGVFFECCKVLSPNGFLESIKARNTSLLEYINGPNCLTECLPYVTVLKRGILKSEFLRLWVFSMLELQQNRSCMYISAILCFTLYIRIAMSCNLLLFKVWRLALFKSCSKLLDLLINTARKRKRVWQETCNANIEKKIVTQKCVTWNLQHETCNANIFVVGYRLKN